MKLFVLPCPPTLMAAYSMLVDSQCSASSHQVKDNSWKYNELFNLCVFGGIGPELLKKKAYQSKGRNVGKQHCTIFLQEKQSE